MSAEYFICCKCLDFFFCGILLKEMATFYFYWQVPFNFAHGLNVLYECTNVCLYVCMHSKLGYVHFILNSNFYHFREHSGAVVSTVTSQTEGPET